MIITADTFALNLGYDGLMLKNHFWERSINQTHAYMSNYVSIFRSG